MNKYNKMKNNYEIILDKIKKQQVRNTQIGEFIDRIKNKILSLNLTNICGQAW